jgi:putative NADPH-quinone reductase
MTQSRSNVLILFAHPAQSKSEANAPLFKAAQAIDGITCVDLYGEYPDYRINIDREQQRLREHDVIIFQFPLYWYSTPSILKEWQDLVLEYGFAYGAQGTALHGKKFLCAITAGGSEKAYHADGFNHFTIRELLQPLEQTANLTGMRYLPPFALFGSRTASEEGRVSEHVERWRQLLTRLQADGIDPEQYQGCNILNDGLFNTAEASS